jgi:hypothetical protein
MERTRALARWRTHFLLARRVTTRFALLGFGLLATPGCRDVDRPVSVAPGPVLLNLSESDGEETTHPLGAPATYTSGLSMSSSRAGGLTLGALAPSFSLAATADPRTIVRIYKDHDAWRTNPDGGRDEATLVSMGKVKGADFFVEPMSSLASGIPSGTRAVIITANSLGDRATSAAQRSAGAQAALVAFLQTGGTVLVDLADNESHLAPPGETRDAPQTGYWAPGATDTPLLLLPTNCADATLAPAAFGADGVPGTADDHRFVRGPDGLAATADDMDDVKIDLARGGSDQQEEQNTDPALTRSSCSVVHGNLEDGITLPGKARVLATATWGTQQKGVLAEYCHMGGRVILNTFTLGYYDHKPREGSAVPLRMSFIQKNLYAYAVSAETYCNKAPTIVAPADIAVPTDGGMCSAIVSLGAPVVDDDAAGVDVQGSRADGKPLADAYPTGETLITWTATDAEGESVSAVQRVSVKDMEAPVIAAPANKAVNTDRGLSTASVDVGNASATDNCSEAPVAISSVRSDGAALDAPYKLGITTITWTAQDAAGNVASATQTILVSDAEAPIVKVPANMAVNATMPSGAKVKYTATASDNVGVALLSCTLKTGTTFPIGVNNVTCTAVDAASNTASASFTVTVWGAPEQIVQLIEYIKGAISPTHRTLLVDYLTRVLAEPRGTATTCRILDFFIAAVRAKSGTAIPVAKANRIITDATRIKAVLACP